MEIEPALRTTKNLEMKSQDRNPRPRKK